MAVTLWPDTLGLRSQRGQQREAPKGTVDAAVHPHLDPEQPGVSHWMKATTLRWVDGEILSLAGAAGHTRGQGCDRSTPGKAYVVGLDRGSAGDDMDEAPAVCRGTGLGLCQSGFGVLYVITGMEEAVTEVRRC